MQSINEKVLPKMLSISKIITRSFKLYRNNFRLFMIFSFFLCVIGSTQVAISSFSTSRGNPILLIVALLFLIPIVYYSNKVIIGLYICIAEIYQDKAITFSDAYRRSGPFIGRYFGLTAGYIALPVILVISSVSIFFTTSHPVAKYAFPALIFIFIIPYLIIYQYAPLASIFEDKSITCFKFSRLLIKNNFGRLFFLAILIFILTYGPFYASTKIIGSFSGGQVANLPRLIIQQILGLFLYPLHASIYCLSYLKLREIKGSADSQSDPVVDITH